MSAYLSECNGLSCLKYLQVRELFLMDGLWWGSIRMIVHWVVNIFFRWTQKSFTHCVGLLQKGVCVPQVLNNTMNHTVFLAESDFSHGLLSHLGYLLCLGYKIPTKYLTVTCRDQRKGVCPYNGIFCRLDWWWFWQKDLVHGRLSFNWFPYVRTHAPRLLSNILIVPSVGTFKWIVGRVMLWHGCRNPTAELT